MEYMMKCASFEYKGIMFDTEDIGDQVEVVIKFRNSNLINRFASLDSGIEWAKKEIENEIFGRFENV